MIKEITVEALKKLRDENNLDFKLVDVREPDETEIATIGGVLVPLGHVLDRLDQFPADKKQIVLYCRSGKRSASAIHLIEGETGQENLYNLKGGILAWADQIDHRITKY